MTTHEAAMRQALEALIAAAPFVRNEAFTKVMMARDAVNESLAQQGEPVAYFQVYRCGIKSRAKIRAEIPREKQGWWADVCPGETLRLRQAVQADIDRCSLNAEHSRNPEDYMCETFTSGALVAKYAIEFMNPEQNVFASVAAAPAPQAQQPLTYDKTEMNEFVLNMYDQKMQEGKHGHYESIFSVVHAAIRKAHGIWGKQ